MALPVDQFVPNPPWRSIETGADHERDIGHAPHRTDHPGQVRERARDQAANHSTNPTGNYQDRSATERG